MSGAITPFAVVTRPDDPALRPAREIYAALVACCDRAMMTRDFAPWRDAWHIPNQAHFDDIDLTVDSPEALRSVFDGFLALMDAYGADAVRREPVDAEYTEAERIVGHHETTFFKAGAIVAGPIASRMTFDRDSTSRWGCVHVTNAIGNTAWPFLRIEETDGLLPELNIRQRMARLPATPVRAHGASSPEIKGDDE